MALDKRTVPILLGPLDTKTDPKLGLQGQIVELENVFRQRTGEYRKRFGTSNLTTSGVGSAGASQIAIGANGDLLLQKALTTATVGHGLLFRYTPHLALWHTAASAWPRPSLRVRPVTGNPYYGSGGVGDIEPSYLSGTITALAPQASDLHHISDATGKRFSGLLMSATTMKVVNSGGFNVLIWTDFSSPRVMTAYTLNSFGTITNFPGTTIASDVLAASDSFIDIKASGSEVFIAYRRSTASTIGLAKFNTGTLAVTTASVAGDPTQCMGWLEDRFATSSHYLAIAGTTNGVQVKTINSSLAVTATDTISAGATANVKNITGFLTSAGANKRIIWEVRNATTYNTRLDYGDWTGSASTGTLLRSVGLASKAFAYGTVYYAAVVYQSSGQSTWALVQVDGTSATAGAALALCMVGASSGLTTLAQGLSAVAAVSTSRFIFGHGEAGGGSGAAAYDRGVIIDIDFEATPAPAETLAGATYLPGALLRDISGQATLETGFNFYPESPTLSGTTGGSLTTLGTYRYVVVWAARDHLGDMRRSAPSVPVAVTLTGAQNAVTVTIPALRLTWRFFSDNIAIAEVYRTTNNGTLYQKVAEVATSPTADTVAVTDLASDATQATGELLYAPPDGGQLENQQPPPCTIAKAHRDRLWLVDAESRQVLWPSKIQTAGYGLGWHVNLRVDAGDDPGDVTALGSMDDKLAIFKRSAIYILTGDGPDNAGVGSWDLPQLVSRDKGTANPASVVNVPDGIMFQAVDGGIYLLTRGLQTVYVGAPVEQYNTLTIVGAALMTKQNQVRFATSSGRTLVYDYHHKEWATFTGQTAVSAVNWDDKWTYVNSSGVVSYEVENQYNDNSSAIAAKIVTGWISLAGLEGFQRIYELHLLGEYVGNHTLTVELAYDYDDAIVETKTVFVTGAPYRWVVRPARQKCAAVKVTVRESSTTGGFRLTGMAAVVGVKRGLARRPVTARLT